MKRRLLITILILGIMTLVAIIFYEWKIYNKNRPLCRNCNILLISIDTLAAKHLECYGYDKETAPNLCNFAKENTLFLRSYSQSFWTRPSQTSVLTGLHATTHGVLQSFRDSLSPKNKTLAKALKEYGYKTYYFGRAADNTSWDESVIRGFDYNEQNIYQRSSLSHWQKALDVLEQNQKNKIPTFMYLHTYYVHAPYVTGIEKLNFVNPENIKKYPQIPLIFDNYYDLQPGMVALIRDSLKLRIKNSNTPESLQQNTELLTRFEKGKTFEEKKLIYKDFPLIEKDSFSRKWYYEEVKDLSANDYLKSLYDERIYQFDTELKSFLDRIKDKFEKDTIVIFYSDHGDTQGERGSYDHCNDYPDCLYMETVEVPLIIRVPGMKSKKIDELAQGIDIFPTIMGLIGKQGPTNLEGEDLTGLMKGTQKESKKDYVISEEDRNKAVIIDKKWSLYTRDLYKYDPLQMELYDLVNDKNQLVNVINNYPEVVAKEVDILKKYEIKQKKYILVESSFPAWLDDIKKQKLIKEGYF